ncbi:hypothetical protein [Catenibacterium sp.]|uniref:hypothetical protein n=1 Tax=Catenibacterium sp. TaxID=2049022 RepID=UPI002E79B887|nr:hypothetical protein [Catenibacterium sp.]
MKSNGRIIIDPSDKKISVYSGKDGTGGSIIGCDSINMYDDSGNLYTSLTGVDIAGRDFVTLTSRYNKKGLHLKRIASATSDDILYILDGLPTSDPKIEGALWMDADRTLKVSSRGFGS